MAANLQLLISAVDNASGTLNKIDKAGGSLGKTLGTALKVGALAGAAGIGIAVVAGLKFAAMAAKEEVGIKRLGAAIDANGGSWAKQGDEVERIIRQRERLSFADDELRDSLSILVAQTGNLDEAMRRQSVAMDLSRGANIDLGTASKLLGKVTDENHAALTRYGIVIDKGADATEVMAAVQAKFAGQSEAFADTSVGKWERFKNTLDNIKEAIGAGLLPVMTGAADLLVRFADAALPKVEAAVEVIGDKVTSLANTIIPPLKDQINNLADTVIPLLEEALSTFVGTLESIAQSDEFQAFLDGVEDGLNDLMVVATTAKQIVVDAFVKIKEAMSSAGDEAAKAGGKVKISNKDYQKLGSVAITTAASLGTITAALAILPNVTIAWGFAIAAIITALILLETRTKLFSKVVAPALEDAFAFFLEHKDETIAALAGVAAMITAVMIPAVVAWTVAEYAKAAALLVAGAAFVIANAPMVALVVGIGLLVAALVWLELKTGFASKSFAFLKEQVEAVPEAFAALQEKFPAFFAIVDIVLGLIENRVMFFVDLIRNIFAIATALWHGDFSAAWDAIKALFSDSLGHILTEFKMILDLLWTAAKEVMPLVKDAIVAALNAAWEFMKTLPALFYQGGKDIANAIGDGFKAAWNGIAGYINSALPNDLKINIPKVDLGWPFGSVGGGSFGINLPDNPLPHLARGGIVTRPTLALIGESGPEAVIPLGRSGGGGVTVHLHINTPFNLSNEADVQRAGMILATEIRRQL